MTLFSFFFIIIIQCYVTLANRREIVPGQRFLQWNRELAKIAQSIFRLEIHPENETSYTATSFLCSIQLTGGLRSGTHYGFITNNHAINLGHIVPRASARLRAFFDSAVDSDDVWLEIHKDTLGWFTDESLDITFFELCPELIQRFILKNLKFLPIVRRHRRKNIEFDVGKEIAMFGFPSAFEKAAFISGKIIEARGKFGNIIYDIVSQPGTSGSPIFDPSTYDIVGVHKQVDYDGARIGISSEAIVEMIEQNGIRAPKRQKMSESWRITLAIVELSGDFYESAASGNLTQMQNLVADVHRQIGDSFEVGFLKTFVEWRPEGRWNALLAAANNSHLEVVEYLVKNLNADVFFNHPAEDGFSAFLSAAYHGRFHVVERLLSLRPDLIESKNFYNNTALNFAAVAGNLEIVDFLVATAGANLENRGYLGRTPLFMAATSRETRTFRYLVDSGADLATESDNGESLPHFVASDGNKEILDIILEKQPELVDKRDMENKTVLHRVVENIKAVDLANWLIVDKAADLQARDSRGRTALLTAAEVGNFPCVKLLLLYGSNLAALDNNGSTAYQLAVKSKSTFIVNYLLSLNSSFADKVFVNNKTISNVSNTQVIPPET